MASVYVTVNNDGTEELFDFKAFHATHGGQTELEEFEEVFNGMDAKFRTKMYGINVETRDSADALETLNATIGELTTRATELQKYAVQILKEVLAGLSEKEVKAAPSYTVASGANAKKFGVVEYYLKLVGVPVKKVIDGEDKENNPYPAFVKKELEKIKKQRADAAPKRTNANDVAKDANEETSTVDSDTGEAEASQSEE